MNKTVFRKRIVVALAISLTVGLSGCTADAKSASSAVATLSSTTNPAQTSSTTILSSKAQATTKATATTTAGTSTQTAVTTAASETQTSAASTADTTATAVATTSTTTSAASKAGTSWAESFAQQVADYDPDSLIPLTGTELAEGVTEEEATAWFKDTMFIGDSVTMGFRNYIMYEQQNDNRPDCMSGPLFFVSGSLSARAALEPISDESLHPLYKGKKRLIEDVVAEVGAKRIFIQLGLNEIAIDGVEAPIDYMEQLIQRILAKSPDVEIHLISTTYMVEGSEKKLLNNANIHKLNYNRMKYAVSKGYGYIDVANNICDENGYLYSDYSSDQYVHQVNKSYAVWEKVFLSYASHQIVGE